MTTNLKPNLKTHLVEEKTIVDKETGEVLGYEIKKHKYYANNKEDFFLAYTSLLFSLRRINWTSTQVYAYILANYPTDKNIGITTEIKKDIIDFIGVNVKSHEIINRSLRILVKESFLIKANNSASTYRINPCYAFKGSREERNKLIATLEVECPNC